MKICGVELSANDAVICFLQFEQQTFNLPDCRVRKVSLPKGHSTDDLRHFQKTFAKLMADYGINKVAIKERALKGKFAGGPIGFKLEATIQLIDTLDVIMLSQKEIKLALSENRLHSTASFFVLKPVAFKASAINLSSISMFVRIAISHVYN